MQCELNESLEKTAAVTFNEQNVGRTRRAKRHESGKGPVRGKEFKGYECNIAFMSCSSTRNVVSAL